MKQSTQYILVKRGQGLMRHSPARPDAAARYTVLEQLGAGTVSTVHRAIEHLADGGERVVALKRLLPALSDDAHFVDAFVLRATAAARLVHGGVCRTFRLGRGGTGWFQSMELVRGRDLGALLRRCQDVGARPPAGVVLALFDQLLAALDHIHATCDDHGRPLGMVHGNLTPANLLIDEAGGRLVLTDVGMHGLTAADPEVSARRVRDKRAYLAPEALRGEPIDGRADLHAAAVIVRELLPTPPAPIDELLHCALDRVPSRRWDSAAALRRALGTLRQRLTPGIGAAQVAAWLQTLPPAPPVRLAEGSVDTELAEPDDEDEDTLVYRAG
jgi:serine/threonine-protein kinase